MSASPTVDAMLARCASATVDADAATDDAASARRSSTDAATSTRFRAIVAAALFRAQPSPLSATAFCAVAIGYPRASTGRVALFACCTRAPPGHRGDVSRDSCDAASRSSSCFGALDMVVRVWPTL